MIEPADPGQRRDLLRRPALDLDANGAQPIRCDENKLRQVLVNLVDNAVKYSPDGGKVSIEVTLESSRMRFAVRDNGLGVPPAEHRRIFEKFVRIENGLVHDVITLSNGASSRILATAISGRTVKFEKVEQPM